MKAVRAVVIVVGTVVVGAHLAACTHSEHPAHSISAAHTYGSGNNRLRVAPAAKNDRSAITATQAIRLLTEPASSFGETRRRVAFGLARITIDGPFRVGSLGVPVVSPKPNPYVDQLGWVAVDLVKAPTPACTSGRTVATIIDPTTGNPSTWFEEAPECDVVSSAAPPTVVCGQVLGGSIAGATVFDISHRQTAEALPAPATIDAVTAGNEVYLRVSDGCVHGADVAMTPTDSYTVDKTALAFDGKPTAVVLCPSRYVPTTVTATVGGQVVGTASINIPALPHGFPSCMGRTT